MDSVSKYFERLEDERHWEQVKLKKELENKSWFSQLKALFKRFFTLM